jgi:hypothetical protein
MQQILRDSEQDNQLKIDGFAKAQIPLNIIDAIEALYLETRDSHTQPNFDAPLVCTRDNGDLDFIKYVDERAHSILEPVLNDLFLNYKSISSAFLIKHPTPGSELALHQDWNLTDEPTFSSFAFWIPLSDTDRSNGNIRVVRGTHQIVPTLRANYVSNWAFEETKNLLEEIAEDVPTKRGECLIINHAVVHGSCQNISNKDRIALITGIVPQEAPLLHYYSEDGVNFDVYQVNTEEHFHLYWKKRPDVGKLINRISPSLSPITETILLERMKKGL